MSKPRHAPKKAKDAKAKPTRSMTERVIVQGGIVILLIILGLELRAHSVWSSAQLKLTTALKKAEDANEHMNEEDVKTVFNGRVPDDTKATKRLGAQEKFDVYNYPGIIARRVLCVHYGNNGIGGPLEVLEVLHYLPEAMKKNRD
jgi:hypothetical protein